MNGQKVLRRRVMVVCVAVVLLLVNGYAVAEEFDWRKFEGTSLNVMVNKNPWSSFLSTQIKEFEERTGIDVTFEHIPAQQYRQKLKIEFVAQSDSIDVFTSLPPMSTTSYWLNGWYEPLDGYLSNPSLTNPNFDVDDFIPINLEVVRRGDALFGIPVFWTTEILMYNQDIFKRFGLTVPKTMEELDITAAKLTRPDEDLYGFTSRGKGGGVAVPPFVVFLYSMGGGWTDANGNAALNSKRALDAFEFYGKLMREYNPPGPLNFSWRQAQSAFIAKRAAMWVGMALFASNVEDPAQSQIVGRAGYSIIPAGSAGSRPQWDGWAMHVSRFSQKREAAWYFVQWATGKEIALKALLAGIGSPRRSSWEAPVFVEGWAMENQEYVDALNQSIEVAGGNEFPPVVDVQLARDITTQPIVAAIEEKDVKAAADRANIELQRLIDQTNRIKDRLGL